MHKKLNAISIFILIQVFILTGTHAFAEQKGKLFVKTNVEGASIKLVNADTVFSQGVELTPGMVVVKISKDGYDTLTKRATITSGKTTTLNAELKKPSAPAKPKKVEPLQYSAKKKSKERLFVKATPKDAEIRVLNIAPKFKQGIELKPGEYQIQIRKREIGKKEITVEMRKGKDLTVRISLTGDPAPEEEQAQETPQPTTPAESANNSDEPKYSTEWLTDPKKGKLIVKITPKDATVKILSIRPKYQPGIELKPGKYRVVMLKEGYKDREATVKINAGKTRIITVYLRKKGGGRTPPSEDREVTPKIGEPPVETPTPTPAPTVETPEQEEAAQDSGAEEPTPAPEGTPEAEQGQATPEIQDATPTSVAPPSEEAPAEDAQDATPTQEATPESTPESTPEPTPEPTPTVEPTPTPTPTPAPLGTLFVETDLETPLIRVLNIRRPFIQGMHLPEGYYVIEAQEKGQKTRLKTIYLKAGEELNALVTLEESAVRGDEQPAEGAEENATQATEEQATNPKLRVNVTPEDAEIRILNIKPKFEQGMELPPGVYNLEVRKEGYEDVKQDVTLKPGGDEVFDITLVKIEKTPAPEEDNATQETASDETEAAEKSAPSEGKGRLFVSTDREEAVIRLPEIEPKFEQGMELDPGEYIVEVSIEGKGSRTVRARVEEGEDAKLNILFNAPKPTPAPTSVPAPEPQPKKADPARELMSQASKAEKSGQFEKALLLINKALELAPDSAKAYKIRGDINRYREVYEDAMADLNKSAQLNKTNASTYVSRGDVFLLMKDKESACHDYWKACSLDMCKAIEKAQRKGHCK